MSFLRVVCVLFMVLAVVFDAQAATESPNSAPTIQFSNPSGTFVASFDLTLSTPLTGAQIWYTLDGSVPSATHGTRYSTPIPIIRSTRVRAIAVDAATTNQIGGANYVKLAPELVSYTSTLPIMVIENFGAGVIPQKGWSSDGSGIKQVRRQTAVWATFDRADGKSSLTNAPQMLSRVGIRGRGAFSSTWRQKPYSVEAENENSEEIDVSPLGLPEESEWILYFPDPDDNKDPSLLFNTFAYELSRRTGHYAVRFRWVEAFVNEDGGDLRLADRRGVYAIMEKVSRGKNRLDFEPLSTDGTTGGWLLNINRMDPEPETGWPAPNGARRPWFFHTAGPNRRVETPPDALVRGDDLPQQINGFLNFDNPNGFNINTNQRAAVEGWFKRFEDVLYNNALWRDPVNGYRKFIDTRDFADYFVLNVLVHNGDGLLISMFPWKGDDDKLRMGPAWDYNWSSYYIGGPAVGDLLWRSEQIWYSRLFSDSDFRQLFVDRWWEMRRGAMSNAGMEAILDEQIAEIGPTKAVLNGIPTATEWTNRLATMKSWLKSRADWIDGSYVRPPAFNQYGGVVPDGFELIMGATNGNVFYTTDGSDPRAPGGSVASSAHAYASPLTINAQTLVQARAQKGANWSGLSSAVFYPPQDLTKLVLTEIMYNPPALGDISGDELEFLELRNAGTNLLHLGTLSFTAGISFTFTNGTQLAPGEFFVLARNRSSFEARYPGVSVNGIYSGKLDNGGETLRLATALGGTVFTISYNDRAPWPLAADGYGFSLVPRDPTATSNSDRGSGWQASSDLNGSPGRQNPVGAQSAVLINEVLTHTVAPQLDQVELFNPTSNRVDVSGWYLSDDGAIPTKFRIPEGTQIEAGSYLLFTEDDFGGPTGFALNSNGDAIYLVSSDLNGQLTGYSHSFSFGAAESSVSFGRYVDSVGEEHFPAQKATSLGSINTGPIVGPVVIQEILYRPDATAEEFLELRNITMTAVPLFDPARPTNTWRLNGLNFYFPTNQTIAAHGVMLIVPIEPENFRARYGLSESIPILGPYVGTLRPSGERLELQRPGIPNTNGIPYITVDEVRYDVGAPWPSAANGGGPSLQRIEASRYGNDPGNWEAAFATPGSDFVPQEAPMIVGSPLSQKIIAYQDAQFEVVASGRGPIYYQWLLDDAPIDGATNAVLVLREVTPAQGGNYRAIVYNSGGSASSAAALLTLRLPATIVQQPQSRTAFAGTSVSFSVSALGQGRLRYQWRYEGVDLTRSTNATLILTNLQPVNAGNYTVVVTDDVGSMRSQTAHLTVIVKPTILAPPQSYTAVQGDTVTFSVSVSGTPPFGYRWRRGTTVLTNQLLIPNNFSSYSITNVQSKHAGRYNVIVSNPAAASVPSADAELVILLDTDGDHLPDDYEIRTPGLDASHAADGALDFDEDGLTNLEEFRAGTDPNDAKSRLAFESIYQSQGATAMGFAAMSNKTYTVQFKTSLPGEGWAVLTNLTARATNHAETVTDLTSGSAARFYRLVTPQTGP